MTRSDPSAVPRALGEDAAESLPADGCAGTLVGRIWDPRAGGPSAVLVSDDGVIDISTAYPTVRDLCEQPDPATAAADAAAAGRLVGSFDDVLRNTDPRVRDPGRPWLLAPVDLQTLKAAGVTFAVSMIERVIEERVRGDFQAAATMRAQILAEIGADLAHVRPGSGEAEKLRAFLTERGLWSQYLEVGIGPDAEIFTKAPTLAAVGTATEVGVPATSTWNNPEPEVALVVGSDGTPVGATLANDVNLRDVEGRSALLLPQAKDNNASCAMGPLLRLFDETFALDVVRSMTVRLKIAGTDGFSLDGVSHMDQISRDPEDLVTQLMATHQYPDGVVLMLGTMFAPVADRDVEGLGFTHKEEDVVRISAAELGVLVNRVAQCHNCEPWSFGIRALMENLALRQLL